MVWLLSAACQLRRISLLAAPMIRERLNKQFLIGAHNQAFLTEYLAVTSVTSGCKLIQASDLKLIHRIHRIGGFGAPVITNEVYMEIDVLRRHGLSLRQIATEVGCAVNTVRSHLASVSTSAPCIKPSKPRPLLNRSTASPTSSPWRNTRGRYSRASPGSKS